MKKLLICILMLGTASLLSKEYINVRCFNHAGDVIQDIAGTKVIEIENREEGIVFFESRPGFIIKGDLLEFRERPFAKKRNWVYSFDKSIILSCASGLLEFDDRSIIRE